MAPQRKPPIGTMVFFGIAFLLEAIAIAVGVSPAESLAAIVHRSTWSVLLCCAALFSVGVGFILLGRWASAA